jgi:hypothetical protein
VVHGLHDQNNWEGFQTMTDPATHASSPGMVHAPTCPLELHKERARRHELSAIRTREARNTIKENQT